MSIRLTHAILAGMQILTAGTALTDVLGNRWAALIALVVGAAQAGLTAYSGSLASEEQKRTQPTG